MKKLRKYRVAAVLLTLVMLVTLLAACGNGTADTTAATTTAAETEAEETEAETTEAETTEAETTEAETTEAEETEPEEEPAELITINFPSIWVGTDSKAEVFGKMVSDFNAENEGSIVVEVEEITDYDLYEDKIRTMISTGAAPDVFTVKAKADMELYASSGKIMDFTDYLAADAEWTDVFLEGFLEGAQYEGKNLAIPYETQLIPIMYNTRLLEEAGVEELPTTWDEFFDVAQKVQDSGVFATTQMTMNNAWTSMLFYTYALASTGGADIYSKGFDDPAYVQAAEIIQKMYDYTSTDAVGSDASVVNGHFFNERAAIYTNGTWILGRIKEEGVEGLYDNLAISGAMSYDGGEAGAYINGVQAYFVAGVQEDKAKEEAVVKFLKYISNPELLTELSNTSGATFAVKREVDDSTDPLLAEIIAQSQDAPYSIGSLESMMPTAVAAEFPPALEALVLGDYTPQEFVDALAAAAE